MKILHLVFIYAILIMTIAASAMARDVNPASAANPHDIKSKGSLLKKFEGRAIRMNQLDNV